jgi:hypothetical protein
LVTIKKIAELNKKVIAVEIHLKKLDRLLPLWQKKKTSDWVLEIYGKDTTSLRVVAEKRGILLYIL